MSITRRLALLTVSVLAGLTVLGSPGVVHAADSPASTAVLVLDTSGSMDGARIEAARRAAGQFVRALPVQTAVGLVTFGGDRVTVVAEPTTDHASLEQDISALQAAGGTAMYDAIIRAADLAVGGRLIVVTDGEDTASSASAEQVSAALAATGTPVDVIAIRPPKDLRATLDGLATRSGGSLVSASGAKDLAGAFEAAVASTPLASPTPHLTAKPAPAPVAPPLTPQESASGALRLAALVFVAILGIAALVAFSWRRESESRRTRDVVRAYARPSLDPHARTLLAPATAERTRFPKTALRLERAGLAPTPSRWLTMLAALGIVLGLLILAVTGSIVVAVVLTAIVTPVGGRAFLRRRARRRFRSFEAELPGFLQVLASGLRAGLSFGQALDAAAGDGSTELSRQMRRALGEVQMGSTVDSALMRVAERVDSEDLRWTVSALAIQREVGGNLSRILETASTTVKSRAELTREVRTLSAEGRLSAGILVALPIGMFGFLALTRREYVQVFWTTGAGIMMLVVITLLITGGWLWMRRVVRIEV